MALDPNEQPGPPISKFESMLKTDAVYFFDTEDFEEIIHHYLNNGRVSLAKKAIRMGLQQHPDAMEIRLLDIEVLVFENQLDRARTLLDDLQQLDSLNQEIYIQRANICSKQDNHRGAIEWLEKARELCENDPDIHSLLGMEHLFLDDYPRARKCFMKCVEFDSQDYASLYNVVYCFEFEEDHKGGIVFLNAYLESNPYCQVAWHQLGKMYRALSMNAEALGAFDFAIIADDTFIGAYFEKAKVLENMGRLEEAIEHYSATLELDDPTSHAYLRMGQCYEKLGDEEQARYYYYLTVHEDPLLDKGWLAITDFYLSKGHFEKAREYIEKAIHIDGENAVYWGRCARIHQLLGLWDEADYAFRQAVDLGNYQLETWVNWAEVLSNMKEPEAALEVLNQGLEFHPEAASLHYHKAGVCHFLQNQKKAEKHLKTALDLQPGLLEGFLERYPAFQDAGFLDRKIKSRKKASE